MKTTNITYGKTLTVIQTENGISSIFTERISNLSQVICDVESFAIRLSLSKIKKTVKIVESLGFSVDIDYDFGFEFECKMYCNLTY